MLALGDTLPGGGAVQSLRVVGLTPGAEVIAMLRPTLGAGEGLYTATAAGLSAELVDDALTCEVTAAPEAGRGGHVVLSVTRRLSETSLSCDLRDALVWSPTGSPALIGDGEFTFDPATAHSGADGRSVVVAVTSEVEPRPVVYELSEGGRRALALAGDRLMGLAEPLAFVGPTRVAGERAFFRGESETGVAVLYQADPFGVRPALSRDTVVDVAPGDQRQVDDWTLSDGNSMNSLASIVTLSGGAPGGASLAVVVLGDAPVPPEPRIDLSLATASSGLALDVTLTLRAARTNASEGAAPAITLRFPADAMEPDEASLERAGCHALDAGSLECARDSDTVPPGGDYSVTFRVWVNAPAGDAIELHASAELSFASGLARAEADATVIAPSSQAEVWVRPLGEGAATTSPTGLGFQIGNAGPDVATEVRLVVPGHPLCAEGCLIGDVSPGVVSVLMDESVLVGLEGVARVTTTALDSDLSNNSAAFDFRPLRGCSVGGAEAAPWPVLFALGLVCLWGRRARRAGRAR